MSAYMLVNLLLVLNFILSFLGISDWAYATVTLAVGALISTLIGLYRHSDKIIKSKLLRVLFSFFVICLFYPIYKIGEYLNQNVYDGLMTVVFLSYVLLVCFLLNLLSKKQINKKEYAVGKINLVV